MRKSKRIFIICMIGAVFFLSGCSERKEKQVEITVMHGWGSTEMDHKEMQKIYSDFQKKYPDISLNLIAMPTGKEMVERAEDRILVGDLPDVIFCGDAGKESLYQFMIENELALDLCHTLRRIKNCCTALLHLVWSIGRRGMVSSIPSPMSLCLVEVTGTMKRFFVKLELRLFQRHGKNFIAHVKRFKRGLRHQIRM